MAHIVCCRVDSEYRYTYGRSVQAFDGVSDRATVPGVMDPVVVRRAARILGPHPQFKEQFGRSYTGMLQAATQ